MNEIIKGIAIFAVSSGFLTWLIQSLGKHFLDKDYGKYKTDLQKLSEEHIIRFTKLHSERGLVIKNLYQKLERAFRSMRSLISPMQLAEMMILIRKKN